MASHAFLFLRATYYRWAAFWPDRNPELQDAPRVLSVGDLHVENFGTWRDSEGRLVWGINDFDECDDLPYTNDLVRLATSALLAAELDRWTLSDKRVCDAILAGYGAGLDKGGAPFVIGERHRWFVPMIMKGLRDPVRFWKRMRALPEIPRAKVPEDAMAGLIALLPDPTLPMRFARRTAGLGSLGKARFVALAEWRSGLVAREAKASTGSASCWARGEGIPASPRSAEILARAVRCPDPYYRNEGAWIVRRLAPDCAKIELSSLSRVEQQEDQLHAMGWETANIHLGTSERAAEIRRDLEARPRKWLRKAALGMLDVTLRDWREWRRRGKQSGDR
jgi:hypothetical protein